jgi:hypothetical protein
MVLTASDYGFKIATAVGMRTLIKSKKIRDTYPHFPAEWYNYKKG